MSKNIYQKSAQCAYNNATQTVASAGTQLQILGSTVCDSGCSITTQNAGFQINNSGLYRITFDATATSTGASATSLVFQLYNGSTPLPCAVSTVSVVQNDVETVHVETTIQLHSCAGVRPVINAVISGIDGTVTHVCASVVRLA